MSMLSQSDLCKPTMPREFKLELDDLRTDMRNGTEMKVLHSPAGACGFLQYVQEPQLNTKRKRKLSIMGSSQKKPHLPYYLTDTKEIQKSYDSFLKNIKYSNETAQVTAQLNTFFSTHSTPNPSSSPFKNFRDEKKDGSVSGVGTSFENMRTVAILLCDLLEDGMALSKRAIHFLAIFIRSTNFKKPRESRSPPSTPPFKKKESKKSEKDRATSPSPTQDDSCLYQETLKKKKDSRFKRIEEREMLVGSGGCVRSRSCTQPRSRDRSLSSSAMTTPPPAPIGTDDFFAGFPKFGLGVPGEKVEKEDDDDAILSNAASFEIMDDTISDIDYILGDRGTKPYKGTKEVPKKKGKEKKKRSPTHGNTNIISPNSSNAMNTSTNSNPPNTPPNDPIISPTSKSFPTFPPNDNHVGPSTPISTPPITPPSTPPSTPPHGPVHPAPAPAPNRGRRRSLKEIKAMKNEMAAENGNRRPSPTFSASFSSSPTNPMLQFNNSPNVISPKPTSTGTPASSPKVGDHTVNFKRAKVAKVLAPCGGSGATIYTVLVDGMSCVMKEFPFSSRKFNKESVDKFNREIETIENLTHPNIVQYLHHEIKRTSIRLFLTRYESSLRAVIQQRATDVQEELDDPFTQSEILGILADIARGLEYLHTHQVIHRDLKSDNIFVCFQERGQVGKVVIGDFDTAKSLVDSEAKTITGTTNYIAPEVMKMIVDPTVQVPYTLKADIWSYAMVSYELLTLQLPYGNFHMTDAISRIQKGERPPIPPSDGGLPDAESRSSYTHVIDIFTRCSAQKPLERPDAEEIVSAVVEMNRI